MNNLSRSEMKVLAALVYCESTAISIRQVYRGQKVQKLAIALEEACRGASAGIGYLNSVPARQTAKLQRLIESHRRETGATHQTPVITSVCLGLMSDILLALPPHSGKKPYLEAVETAMRQLHGYFDRKGQKWDEYLAAGKIIEVWDDQFELAA